MSWSARLKGALHGEIDGGDVRALLAATGPLTTLRTSLDDRRLEAELAHAGEEWRVAADTGESAAPLWLADALLILAGSLIDAEADAHPDRQGMMSVETHSEALALLRPMDRIVTDASATLADPSRNSTLPLPIAVGPFAGGPTGALNASAPPVYLRGLLKGAERLEGAAQTALADFQKLLSRSTPPNWIAVALANLRGDFAAAQSRLQLLNSRLSTLLAQQAHDLQTLHQMAADLWQIINTYLRVGQVVAAPRLLPAVSNPFPAPVVPQQPAWGPPPDPSGWAQPQPPAWTPPPPAWTPPPPEQAPWAPAPPPQASWGTPPDQAAWAPPPDQAPWTPAPAPATWEPPPPPVEPIHPLPEVTPTWRAGQTPPPGPAAPPPPDHDAPRPLPQIGPVSGAPAPAPPSAPHAATGRAAGSPATDQPQRAPATPPPSEARPLPHIGPPAQPASPTMQPPTGAAGAPAPTAAAGGRRIGRTDRWLLSSSATRHRLRAGGQEDRAERDLAAFWEARDWTLSAKEQAYLDAVKTLTGSGMIVPSGRSLDTPPFATIYRVVGREVAIPGQTLPSGRLFAFDYRSGQQRLLTMTAQDGIAD